MSPRLRHLPQGGNAKKPFPMVEMAYETVCSCFRGCGAYGSCWFLGRAFGATRSSVLRTSTPQATRSPASFHTCSNPSSSWSSSSPASGSCYLSLDSSVLRSSGFSAFCPWFPVPRSLGPLGSGSLAPAPWLRLLGSLAPLDPLGSLCSPRLAPHRHPAADYLRASLASMHSVAWGTFIRRSFGMSLPVVLQMP